MTKTRTLAIVKSAIFQFIIGQKPDTFVIHSHEYWDCCALPYYRIQPNKYLKKY